MTPRSFLPSGLTPQLERVLRARCAEGRPGVVVDLDALERRYAAGAAAAAANDVRLLYAVKGCTLPAVTGLAVAHGLGFDIANLREHQTARTVSRTAPVSLTSPGLPLGEREPLYDAFRAGDIRRWHADSLGQLEDLVRACPGRPVGVRVNLDGLAIPDDLPLWRPSRFGIRLDELGHARDLAAEHGCRLAWLHTHNGSEENDLASYVFTAEAIVTAAADAAVELEALDLGGGLLAEPTRAALGAFFATVRRAVPRDVELTLEPGRFWLTDCIGVLAQVLDVKPTAEAVWLLLDVGMMSHLQWCYSLRIPTLGPVAAGDSRPWKICGRSCYEEDVLEEDEHVPTAPGAPVPRADDWFVLGNVTGYSLELTCDFNGVTPPSVELWRAGEVASNGDVAGDRAAGRPAPARLS